MRLPAVYDWSEYLTIVCPIRVGIVAPVTWPRRLGGSATATSESGTRPQCLQGLIAP